MKRLLTHTICCLAILFGFSTTQAYSFNLGKALSGISKHVTDLHKFATCTEENCVKSKPSMTTLNKCFSTKGTINSNPRCTEAFYGAHCTHSTEHLKVPAAIHKKIVHACSNIKKFAPHLAEKFEDEGGEEEAEGQEGGEEGGEE